MKNNTHRYAALALVGWYLMAPPLFHGEAWPLGPNDLSICRRVTPKLSRSSRKAMRLKPAAKVNSRLFESPPVDLFRPVILNMIKYNY